MAEWIKYRRKGGAASEPAPFISIRRSQIALNAQFVATANLGKKSHVSIFADPKLFRLGFRFHDSGEDPDAYALTNDGGGKVGRGRCVAVAALMREHPWLVAIANIENPRLRHFEPKWISTDSMWVISLCPCFEHRAGDRSEIASGARGIYRYKRGSEIVYIGRGVIRSRFGSQERAEWDFDTVEYSLVPDDADQIKWEAFWLRNFEEQHRKRPLYNHNSGARSAVRMRRRPERMPLALQAG